MILSICHSGFSFIIKVLCGLDLEIDFGVTIETELICGMFENKPVYQVAQNPFMEQELVMLMLLTPVQN